MGKYNKLGANIFTFFIGNMGSRLIQFIFIPMYTYWLTAYEYGIIDTIVITVSLCTPFVSLSIHDALLRYMLDKERNLKEIYTISCLIALLGTIIFGASFWIFRQIDILRPYWGYFYLYMVVTVFFYIQSAYIRGLEFNKFYALLGIVATLFQALGILLLVGWLRLGVEGYLSAMIVAYGIVLLLSVFVIKSWRNFSFSSVRKDEVKSMLTYSIPLVPNAMMWWIINSSDKYMILYYLSAEANGIFAIAAKIPMVINIIYQIFLMAWQISVIEEHNQEGREKFYHTVYSFMISGLFLCASLIMVFLKPAVATFLSAGYNEVWRYIPILLLSAIFTCLAGFYGSFYVAFKNTKGALKTSLFCAMINIAINLLSIRYLGLLGVSLANLLCFLILYVYRVYDTKTLVSMSSEKCLVFYNTLILSCQILVIYFMEGCMSTILLLVLFGLVVIINKSVIKEMISMSKQLIKKYRHGKIAV